MWAVPALLLLGFCVRGLTKGDEYAWILLPFSLIGLIVGAMRWRHYKHSDTG